MKEEKMMILSMLEEGKITSEVAIRLIEALEDGEIPKFHEEDEIDQNYDYEKSTIPNTPIFNGLEDLGSDISSALTNMFNGFKDMNYSFGFRGNSETISEDFDLDLDFEDPSLDLNAVNGSIILNQIDGNKLRIRALCQYKMGFFRQNNESFYNFIVEENRVIFKPKYNNNISVTLEVSLPRKHYNEVLLNSSNGRITVKGLDSHTLICTTTNSSLDIANVNSQNINLTTKNGRIECKDLDSDTIKAYTKNSNILFLDVNSPDIDIKTTNARIEIDNINTETIICKTSNDSIKVHNTDINKIRDIKLITSNGSISSDFHQTDRDVYLDLETSMGSIKMKNTNLIYKVNKHVDLGLKKIIAHSLNFDENKDHLKIVASTSNGSIKVY